MKWENLYKLMDMMTDDIEKVGYFEMTMTKGKHAIIKV